MNIRRAEISDASEIARIHVETWRIAYAEIVPSSYLARLDKEERAKSWANKLSDPNEEARVAVLADGSIAGWTSFGPSRDNDDKEAGEVYAIYVDQSHWGQGTGRTLLTDAILHLGRKGYSSVSLWVLEENQRARRFYEKAGFDLDGASKSIEIDESELREFRYRSAT